MLVNLFNKIWSHFFSIGVLFALYFSLLHHNDNLLSAAASTGYIFDIVAGSLVIALLLYPLSKRVAELTRRIPVRYLFNKIWSQLFPIGVLAALYFGWLHRDDNYISAETGAGYTLGLPTARRREAVRCPASRFLTRWIGQTHI